MSAPPPPDFTEPIVVQFRADREYATDLNQFTGFVSKFNLVPPSAVKNQSELTRRYSLPARTFQNDTNIFFMPPPNRKLRKDGLESQPRDVMIETLTNRSSFKTWMTQHTSKLNVNELSQEEVNKNTGKNAEIYTEFLFDDGESFYKSPFTNDNSFTIIDNSFISMEPPVDLTNYRDQRFSVNFILDLVPGKPREIKNIIRAKKCEKRRTKLDQVMLEQGVAPAIKNLKDILKGITGKALGGIRTFGESAFNSIAAKLRLTRAETSESTEGGGKRKSKRKRRNLTRKKGKAKKQRKTKKRQHRKPKQEA
jgi:hypothetical protein